MTNPFAVFVMITMMCGDDSLLLEKETIKIIYHETSSNLKAQLQATQLQLATIGKEFWQNLKFKH